MRKLVETERLLRFLGVAESNEDFAGELVERIRHDDRDREFAHRVSAQIALTNGVKPPPRKTRRSRRPVAIILSAAAAVAVVSSLVVTSLPNGDQSQQIVENPVAVPNTEQEIVEPATFDEHYAVAADALRKQDFDRALKQFQAAMDKAERDRERFHAAEYISTVQFCRKDYVAYLKHQRERRDANDWETEDPADFYSHVLNVHVGELMLGKAQQNLQQYFADCPDDYWQQDMLGMFLKKANHREAVEDALAKLSASGTRDRDGDRAAIYYLAGEYCASVSNFSQAVKYFEAAAGLRGLAPASADPYMAEARMKQILDSQEILR